MALLLVLTVCVDVQELTDSDADKKLEFKIRNADKYGPLTRLDSGEI